MMTKWRLIEVAEADAPTQMATDEAIAIARLAEGNPNTIRLYRWRPSAVSVGYFQSLLREVDVEGARSLGVDIIRRITGGGAVFHDHEGEITYSLVASDSDPEIPSDILESYMVICNCIVLGLRNLGIDSEFKPINDIAAEGRKISGNAQTRRHGAVLQHGTILLDCDVAKVFRVLKVSGVKLSDKAISSAEERVTSARKILGHAVDWREAQKAIVEGFEAGLGVELSPGTLTPYEKDLTAKLKVKYSSREWIYQR